MRRAVSRVLFPQKIAPLGATVIHLGRPLPTASCGSPGRHRTSNPVHKLICERSLFSLASGGVYHARYVTTSPVRSYRTFSPLPRRNGAVYFLRHFPWGYPHRALPGTLLYEARTFLQQKYFCRRPSGPPQPYAL